MAVPAETADLRKPVAPLDSPSIKQGTVRVCEIFKEISV